MLPQIYKICPEEFNTYIKQLEKAELIIVRTTDNITYYDLSIRAINCTRKAILDIIKSCSEGIVKGVMQTALESA